MQDTTFIHGSHVTGAAYPLTQGMDTPLIAEPAFHFEDAATTVQKKDTAAASIQTYVNFYSGHELPVKHGMYEIAYRDLTPDWLFFVILLIVSALAWIRYFYGKIFGQTLQAIFNVNITNQIVRDENVLLQRTSAFLGVIFNIVFALILYHASIYFNWHLFNLGPSFGRFLFLVLAVSAVYSFKFLLLKVIGFIFSVEKEIATYIFNIFLINNMLGLLLIPFAILLSFPVTQHPAIFVIIACILYGLAFNYRIFRGALIGLSFKGVNLVYLFLYFCALEFAPMLVFLKILSR